MTVHLPPEIKNPPHPFWLMILYLPFGASSGYFIVTLGYLLPKGGISVVDVAGLIALFLFPNTWKVLWAPVIDTTLTARSWYIISVVTTGLIFLATAFIPATPEAMWPLRGMALLSSITSSVCAMAAERLMAHTTPDHLRGRAGGWCQAGNLGGSGLGGGGCLWMAQHVAPWTAGAALGVGMILCCFALLPYEEPHEEGGRLKYGEALVGMGKDIWSIAISRVGMLTMLLLFLPIGAGGASNLWSAIAGEWKADADVVALVNGALNGVVSMAGCLVGGYLSDVVDRKTGYSIFGIILAVCAIAMAEAPRTVEMFVLFTLTYYFILGLAYAAFTAVTLETIGRGAAATKYNLLACLSNIPITYMTEIDGWAQGKWGTKAMLYTEAFIGFGAILFFALVSLSSRPRAARAKAA
jgi:PAT family beta-lactamase induction signal transducer AmpG